MSLRKLLTRLAIGLAALVAAVFAAAFVAILWGDPAFPAPLDLSPAQLAELQARWEQKYPSQARSFRLPDGTTLSSQFFPAESPDTLVFVHGVLGSAFQHNQTSGLLREATGASVVALDLRGHGASQGRPGDTDYIGQYEDDLAEVIRQVRAAQPGGRLILAGHSMGGGIALRYALRPDFPPVDRYLLFAPHMGTKSPTMPQKAAADGPDFARLHLPRTLGLAVLSSFGITAFNGLHTLFFNLPPELPLRSYSFRAMVGMAPDDVQPALAAIHVPLLVVVGSRDEAFVADAYAGVLRGHPQASLTLVPDANHDGVLLDPRAIAAVKAWLAAPR